MTRDYKIFLDHPSENPVMGFAEYAQSLYEIIESSRPQFAIGIFGTWGSGKTTLMRAVEAKLKPEQSIAVRFNAWRYEREQHLIVPLLDTVRESLIHWSELTGFKDEAGRVTNILEDVIASLMSAISVEVGIPDVVKFTLAPKDAIDRSEQYDEKEKAAKKAKSLYHSCFGALQEAFSGFIGKDRGPSRIVVFIDDLDRCLPKKALEVLEAMKLFFDLEGFIFVVALDRDVIEWCVDARYKEEFGQFVPGQQDSTSYTFQTQTRLQLRGSDYIKKIFQVPFFLAPMVIEQLDEFLEALLATADVPRTELTEITTVVRPHLDYLSSASAGVNPRDLKRYLNAYVLQRKLKSHLDPDIVLCIQTISFRSDWAAIRGALISYRGMFINALRGYIEEKKTDTLQNLGLTGPLPSSFLDYIAVDHPGEALIYCNNIDEYIYAGLTTTQGYSEDLLTLLKQIVEWQIRVKEINLQSLDAINTFRRGELFTVVTRAISSASALDTSASQQIIPFLEQLRAFLLAPISQKGAVAEWTNELQSILEMIKERIFVLFEQRRV